MQGATITGWGTALPGTVLGNDELAARFGTTPAWIEERTGIVEPAGTMYVLVNR